MLNLIDILYNMKKLYTLFLFFVFSFLSLISFGQASLPLTRTAWGTTPTGWTDNGTHRNTSFACTGNSGGSMQATGKYYLVYFSDAPKDVTYSLKGTISGTGSDFRVQESVDGLTWTDVATYTSFTFTTCTTFTKTLLSTSRYVRFIYVTKTSGNVDIDDVTITKLTSGKTVTFDSNEGTGSMSPQTSSVPASLDSNTFTKTCSTFNGWNTQADGSGTPYADGATYSFSADITLYAQWNSTAHTVTFDANTGSGTMPNQTACSPTNLTSNVFSKTGYSFSGWATSPSGSVVYANNASYNFLADITLYAVWTINTYTVTFNGNGHSSGSPSVASVSGNYGSTVTLATDGTLAKTGYHFGSWNTASDGSGTNYTSGGSYTIGASNITLYAKWIPNNYTITFDGNGATGGSTASQTLAYTSTASLNTNGYTKTGFVFKGWNTQADGSGTTYLDGASYTMGLGDVTLYAIWKLPTCFEEDFSSITTGDNTTTGGSSSSWSGNSNFPTVSSAYQAGGAVRLGTSSSKGSIESMALAGVSGNVEIKIGVKGWSSVEGDLKVSLDGNEETKSYSAKMADPFETITINFTDITAGAKLKIETTAKRAFIDFVEVYCSPACTKPTTQASNVTFSSVESTSMQINWTNGTGDKRIVVVREGSAVSGKPVSGTTYTANATFGSGDIIKTNEYVVYNGTGSSVVVNGLKCNTTYHVAVFEYNNTDVCYLKTSPATGNQKTAQPTLSVTGSFSTFSYPKDSGPSSSQSVNLSGTKLVPTSGSVTITTSTSDFEVSLDNATFSNSVSLSYTGGAISSTPIYVRLKAGLVEGTYTANLTTTVASPPSGCSASTSTSISGEVTFAPCHSLFISEVIEGLGNDKSVEIYNPTSSSVSLANYKIKIYNNGSGSPSSTIDLDLSKTIAAYGTYVLSHSSASSAILAKSDQTNSIVNFDGNDAIALDYNTTHLDIFGKIGHNPGTAWTSGSHSTQNQTLVRHPNVQLGITTNPGSGFPTLATQWLSFPTSESAYLGVHYSTCQTTSVIIPDEITPSVFCVSATKSATFSLDFTSIGTFNAGNEFQAQLSDASGSFATPTTIGTLSLNGTDVTGTITCTIPAGTSDGTEYKVRIIATNPTGSLGAYASRTKLTIQLGPLNVTSLTGYSSGDGNANLSWVNPSCLDEILVIACSNGPVTTVPSGDGSAYEVAADNACMNNICEEVLYKGIGSSLVLSDLESGTNYNFKVFTRLGTSWSSGVNVSVIPGGATTIQPGDFAVLGLNSDNNSCGSPSAGDDSIYFVCFKDIQSGTTIDITDNGWSNCTPNKFNNTEGFYRVTYTGATIPAGTIISWYMDAIASSFPVNLSAGWSATQLGSNPINTNSGGDQIFFLQGGTWNNGTPSNNDATYLNGRLLFAFNTKTTWGAAPNCGSTDKRTQYSELPDEVVCFEQSPSTSATDYFLYTGSTTTADTYTWLSRILDKTNWTPYSNCTNFNTNINTVFPNRTLSIDNTIPTNITWDGSKNTNWYDCDNWSGNKVPSTNVNVEIPNTATNMPVIDADAEFASQFLKIATCRNLTIKNGATLTVGGKATNRIDIYNNLVIENGAQLIADDSVPSTSDGIIRVVNWDNQAGTTGFLEGNSTVKFFGLSKDVGATYEELKTSATTESFHNLTIEKPTQAVLRIFDDIVLDATGVLTFNCGGIISDFGANKKITINNADRVNAITGFDVPNNTGTYTDDKYISCQLERNIQTNGEYVFPIGSDPLVGGSLGYNPIRFNKTSGTGMATAKFIEGNPGTINVPYTSVICSGQNRFVEYTGMTGLGYWNMSSSTGTSFNYSIYLHPNSLNTNTFPNDNSGIYRNNYRALKAPTGTGGGTWPTSSGFDGDECIVSDNYYEVVGSGYTGFSDFGIGGGAGNTTALPIELLSFTSTCLDNGVQLNWITASERNNKQFIVEKSLDGVHFEAIGFIAGAGYSSVENLYQYTDHSNDQKAYYRLKQVDFDGTETIHPIVFARCGQVINAINIYYAGNNTIQADIQTNVSEDYQFRLYQVDGKLLHQSTKTLQVGRSKISIIPKQQLSKGVYLLQVINGANIQTKKLWVE